MMKKAILLLAVLFSLSVSGFAAVRAKNQGWCEQGNKTITVQGYTSSTSTPVQRSYPSCTVTVYVTGGGVGTVTTNGTAVTWVSGTLFNPNGQWSGLTITINAVTYTISNVSSTTALTLNSTAGVQTNVAYGVANAPAAIYSDNAGTARANPFAADSFGAWFFYADDGTYDVRFSGGGITAPFTSGAWETISAYVLQDGTGAISRLKSNKLKDIVQVKDFGALCDGTTDDRASVQAAITAANGLRSVTFPDGATCLITPIPAKTKFLDLPPGTILRGKATLKIASGSAPYDRVIWSNDCTGCDISDLRIDSNVAGNPAVDNATMLAHPRTEIFFHAANDAIVQNIVIFNSTSVSSIYMYGDRNAVLGSTFYNMGDDPNHVVHDLSTLYLEGEGVRIEDNHFSGASRGAPAATTAIETHATNQNILGNTVQDYNTAVNFTGIYAGGESAAGNIVGNTFFGVLRGVVVWSMPFLTHTTGYGINGLTISGNSMRINQLDYATGQAPLGVEFSLSASLPITNVVVSNNTIVFDLENASHTADYFSTGIGSMLPLGNITYSNISITGNTITNAPFSGIGFTVDTMEGLEISHNIIRNPGSSLYGAWSIYKIPIYVVTTVGKLSGTIHANQSIDDFTTSRLVVPMFLGAGTSGGELRVIDNSVDLLGTTTTSQSGYIALLDDNVSPFVRQTTNLVEAWPAPARNMQAGSWVYDRTTDTNHYLWSTGTAWTTAFKTKGYIGATVTITGDYTVTQSTGTIFCDSTAASRVISLGSGATGQIVSIKKVAANNYCFVGFSGGTIDGSATLSLANVNASITVQWDGSKWWLIERDTQDYHTNIRSVSTTTSTVKGEGMVLCDTSGGGFTVTLSTPERIGEGVTIKKISAANTLYIAPFTGQIDGAVNLALTTIYSSVLLQWDGTNWWVVARHL